MRTYDLTTFGCQMNEHDSERIRGVLESLGLSEARSRDEADLILFNTCSVREKADSRLVGRLGEAKRVKRHRPEVKIAVGGCWSQSMRERVFSEFPFVDLAFGPGSVGRLPEMLARDDLGMQGRFEFEGFTADLPTRRGQMHRAWVQVSVGCNCACAYCIVPSVRGGERSRHPRAIVDEVEALAGSGVREVTLLGQNVNSYGRDLPPHDRIEFAALLERIDGIDGIDRIRFTSPHPKDMREPVVRAVAELESLCEHIHLPLQSGSSRVLAAMRRTYDRRRYMERVEMIRSIAPGCALTTDVIVGFPGETEIDFTETLEVVESVGFESAFTFIYSPRPRTEAAGAPDHVPEEVKSDRMRRLVDLVQRRAHEVSQRYVGSVQEVLVDGPSRTDPGRMCGRTRSNKTVNFDGRARAGDFVEVKIESATSTTLAGTAPANALARCPAQ